MQELLKALPPEFWQALLALVFTAVAAAVAALFEQLRKRVKGETELALLSRVERAAWTAVAATEQRFAQQLRKNGKLTTADAAEVLETALAHAREELGPASLRALDKITDPATDPDRILIAKIEAAVQNRKQRGYASPAFMIAIMVLGFVGLSLSALACAPLPQEPPKVPVPPPSEPAYQRCLRVVKAASHREANDLCPPGEVQWLECEHRAGVVRRLEQSQAECRKDG